MKQELINKIRDAVKGIEGVCISEDPGCPYIVLIEDPKGKVLFTNSIGEEFTKTTPAWWYHKEFYSVSEISINKLPDDDTIYSDGEVLSELYLSEETAYQKSIEYAHSQGERITYGYEGKQHDHVGTSFLWDKFKYKVAPKPKYRPWTMEDEEVDSLLMVKVRTKDYKERYLITCLSNEELEELFNDSEHMNGALIGKKI